MRSALAIESARSESALGCAMEPAASDDVVPSFRTGMRRVDVTVVFDRVVVFTVVSVVTWADAVPAKPMVSAAATPSATRFSVIIVTFLLLSW